MTDVTQGATALDDTALFNEVTQADTLEKFENPDPVPPPVKPEAAPPEKKDDPSKLEARDDNAPVPPGRLREEAEGRRKAERERDELQRRFEVLARQVPQQPQQRPQPETPDLLDNPRGFVQAELRPFIDELRQDFQAQREAMSRDYAIGRYGYEKVDEAYGALVNGMRAGDPSVKAFYEQVMSSHDPYGMIARWHQQNETLRSVGGDVEAFKKRVLEEAINDPEYRKRIIETARSQASATGNSVARPVVASSPSLGNVGAAGGEPQAVEPDDMTLFRAATQARRR